jgi:hypothetical protein
MDESMNGRAGYSLGRENTYRCVRVNFWKLGLVRRGSQLGSGIYVFQSLFLLSGFGQNGFEMRVITVFLKIRIIFHPF